VRARASGYAPSDTVRVVCAGACTADVVMGPVEDSRFVVFPTVVRAGDGLRVEFLREGNAQSSRYTASVRTASGMLVWQAQGRTPVGAPLRLAYDCRSGSGARLTPGTYLFVFECGGTRIQKFLVLG